MCVSIVVLRVYEHCSEMCVCFVMIYMLVCVHCCDICVCGNYSDMCVMCIVVICVCAHYSDICVCAF